MNARKGGAHWFFVGVPLLLAAGFLGAVGLHVGLGLLWRNIVGPVLIFLTVQVSALAGMFWARKRGSLRVAMVVSGLYCLSAGLLVMHYGSLWGLLSWVRAPGDYVGFTLCIAIATVVGVLLCSKLDKQRSGG